MPKQSSRDRAERPPLFGYLDKFVRARPFVGTGQFLVRGMQSDIATRHHVRPKQRHQQIYISGPDPDSFEFDKFGLDLVVWEKMYSVEIDMFLDDRLGKVPGVRSFLTAETDGLEIGVIHF